MKMRSTGLGKTELVGHLDGITRNGDYLVLSVRCQTPKWHIRTAMSHKDAIDMLKFLLRPQILLFLLTCVGKRDEGRVLNEY